MELPQHCDVVRPEWIDSNGHMNLAFYIVVFDRAGDVVFDALDIGTDYRRRSGHSSFVVETHTLYEREATEGTPLRVATRVLGADAKRLHLFQQMFHAERGERLATHEQMCLHVDMATRRVTSWPADRLAALQRAASAAPELGAPPEAGRRIALPEPHPR
jgi:acyl-CoA thioester hydrolase